MIGWTREISEQMFTLSKKMNKIESLVVNKGDKEIVIFSAPREEIYFKKMHEDPLYLEIIKHKHDLLCIQFDPMNTMIKFRDIGNTLITKRPDLTENKKPLELEHPIVNLWQECQADKAIQHYMCENIKDEETYVNNIESNIFGNNYIKYPYVNSSLLFSMLNDENPVLIDIPEQLFRINIANSFTILQIREFYDEVLSTLKNHYKKDFEEFITGYQILHENHPDVFQKIRDLFCISFLQSLAKDNNILAVLSAPTFVACKEF